MAAIVALPSGTSGEPKDIPNRPPPLTFDKHVDYITWYNDFVRQGRDEKDNAYLIYLKICPDENGKGGIRPPEGKAAEQLNTVFGRTWTAKQYPELAAYLQECEPFERIVAEAVRHPACWARVPNGQGSLAEFDTPVLANARQIAKVVLVNGWIEHERHRERRSGAWRILLKIASHMEEVSFTTSGLVAISIRSLVHQDIIRALAEGAVLGEKSDQLVEEIANLEPSAFRMRNTNLVQWAVELSLLQDFFRRTGGDAKRWKVCRSFLQGLGLDAEEELKFDFDFEASGILIDELNAQLVLISGDSPTQQKLDRLREYEARSLSKIRGNSFVKLVHWSPIRTCELAMRAEAERRGTLVTLALHAAFADRGKWPASLESVGVEVKVKGLKNLMIDPYSDKPFIYKLRDGQPLLYSVGVDGKDDGGKHHPKFGEKDGGDYVFWPWPKLENRELPTKRPLRREHGNGE